MVSLARLSVGLVFVVALGAGCTGESEPGDDGGDETSGGGSGASAGGAASGGTTMGGLGGAVGNAASGGGGGTGATGTGMCLTGVAGIWVARGFPAYLEIDSACRVNLFCDVENDYHTTGYVDDDLLVLIDLTVKRITVVGDVLTVLDAEAGVDLPFDRQTSSSAIPAECRI
jgi:hypothetical protein